MKGICVKIVLALTLLIGFTCGTVYAQTFDIWNNSMWKIKTTAKGVVFSDPTVIPDGKARDKGQSWAIMYSNAAGDDITLQIYQKNPDTDECEEGELLTLTKQFGGPLGFVATIESEEADPLSSIRALLYFTGKLQDAALKTGKITSLGGYILEQGWDEDTDRAAYGFTLSGTWLKEPKGCLL